MQKCRRGEGGDAKEISRNDVVGGTVEARVAPVAGDEVARGGVRAANAVSSAAEDENAAVVRHAKAARRIRPDEIALHHAAGDVAQHDGRGQLIVIGSGDVKAVQVHAPEHAVVGDGHKTIAVQEKIGAVVEIGGDVIGHGVAGDFDQDAGVVVGGEHQAASRIGQRVRVAARLGVAVNDDRLGDHGQWCLRRDGLNEIGADVEIDVVRAGRDVGAVDGPAQRANNVAVSRGGDGECGSADSGHNAEQPDCQRRKVFLHSDPFMSFVSHKHARPQTSLSWGRPELFILLIRKNSSKKMLQTAASDNLTRRIYARELKNDR